MDQGLARIPARSHRQAMDWSLALVSQGIESTIQPPTEEQSGWNLAVDPASYEAAVRIIRQYRVENLGWPWRQRFARPGVLFDWGSAGWAVLIILLFWVDSRAGLRTAGLMDSTEVSRGAWWRLFTAVWLHGDLGHLASNATSGFLLLGLAMGRYGTGAGLLAAYLAGVLGNVAGWGLSDPHRSLGASGMVMGALGLLAGQTPAFWGRVPGRLRYILAGAIGGTMLFVLFGLSPNTDVLAHAGGFAAGLLLGMCVSRIPSLAERSWTQFICGALFALLVVVPWWLAISRLRGSGP